MHTKELTDLLEYSANLSNEIVTLNTKILSILRIQKSENDDVFITVKEASEILNITPAGIRYQISHNLILSKRKGVKILLVSKKDVLQIKQNKRNDFND